MKKALVVAVALLVALGFSVGFAKDANAALGGQVFYKFGVGKISGDRGGEVFTDFMGTPTLNDGDSGSNIGAGLDIPLTKLGPGTLLGEVMLEHTEFSAKKVTATLGIFTSENVTVSEFAAIVAPKYRLEFLDGKLRPWVIPIGLAFLVNSPPSDDVTYLSTGLHFGVGVEYVVHPLLSVGIDYRATKSHDQSDAETSYSTMGAYVGINF